MSDLPDPDIDLALEGLVAKELISEISPATAPPTMGFEGLEHTRQFAFSHLFLREVAREMVPKAQRPKLHMTFADWLEEVTGLLPWGQKTHVQTLAPNLYEAWRLLHERGQDDPLLAERTIRACLAAADAQRSCQATREALQNVRRALEIARASMPHREPEVTLLLREVEQTPAGAI
jgi:predicted ATPase